MTGLFVTGTDTGVGKTFITAAIATRLRARRWKVAAVKPAESGCLAGDNGLVAADAEAIAHAAGDWQPPSARCLYRLREAVAPGVAARREGVDIWLDECVDFVRGAARDAEIVLVEGAGGWRVPLDGRGATIADLARAIALPVLIVGRAALGTINHTVLTAEAVSRDGCALVGIVLSVRPEDDATFARSNADQIESLVPGVDVWLVREPADVDPLLGRFTWNDRAR